MPITLDAGGNYQGGDPSSDGTEDIPMFPTKSFPKGLDTMTATQEDIKAYMAELDELQPTAETTAEAPEVSAWTAPDEGLSKGEVHVVEHGIYRDATDICGFESDASSRIGGERDKILFFGGYQEGEAAIFGFFEPEASRRTLGLVVKGLRRSEMNY
jgi:hypothetical protein